MDNKHEVHEPVSMSRKTFLRLSLGAAAIAGTGGLTGCAAGDRLTLSSLDGVLSELALIEAGQDTIVLDQPWPLYKVLNHLAQSMEYSMTGYPQMDSAAKQALAKLVFNVFKSQGFMTHDLGAPVPGAPEIPEEGPLADAIQRLRNSCSDFQNYTGALHPHFSYGELNYEDWELAHSFHCADHFNSMTYTRPE